MKLLWVGTKSWLELANMNVLCIKWWTPSDQNNRYTHSLLSWNYFHSSFHACKLPLYKQRDGLMELYYTSAHIIIIYCIYTDFLSFLFFSDIINNSILTINKIISIGFVMFMKTSFILTLTLADLIFYS